MKNKRKRFVIFCSVIILITFLCCAFYNGLAVRTYTIKSGKITQTVKIALLTDLHSCLFGKNQIKLIDEIANQNPDIVLMSGDIADDVISITGTVDLLEGIKNKYPCYYVSGNHEFWSGEQENIKEMFRSYGVTVLEGDCEIITVNGQTLNICGVDDPEAGETTFAMQLEQAFESISRQNYTILLSHRPERIDQYLEYNCDLILAGHAHGGQWRIPFFMNGLYAPNQGLLPKYAGGLYEFNGTNMIVSRGLAKYSTRVPRIFNPPELVVINIIADQ